MKDDTINVRINQYTGAIEAIPEGRRNDGIYNAGLCLRGLFGQTDDALEATLQKVNQSKCLPPLPPDEVTTIARSVDRSDAPIGEPDTAYNRQISRKALKHNLMNRV